ncbi:SAP domain-containing ribonucleoprotein-like [Watersipora subatra]|uniref:SAP domain-containing ribonucleoprotein-like n=1 Tax=Watersipora subatra TaxID=2589382 RepID=UPI00355C932D
MASELTSADLPKLKVQDLKRELKARDLSITGNKGELLNRLEEALKTLEAEALLEDAGNETDETSLVAETPVKPALSAGSLKVGDAVKGSAAAKSASPLQAVTAPPIPGSTTITAKGTTTDEVESTEQKKLSRAERFGVVSEDVAKSKRAERFGIVSEEDKKAQRAAKFGLPVENGSSKNSDAAEKKSKRAERFGITASTDAADSAEITEEARQRLLKRKERFGEVTSSLVNKADTDEKLKQRAARFGAIAPSVVTTEDEGKKKKRMERFTAA